MISGSSLKVGTLIAEIGLPWPPDHTLLLQQMLTDGELAVSQTRDARLAVELYEPGDEVPSLVDRAESCPITCHDDNRIVLIIRWKDCQVSSVHVDDRLAYSSASGAEVVRHIGLVLKPFSPSERRDFSPENEDARDRRRAKLAARVSRPDRIPQGRDYAFLSLKGELLQIRDIASAVESGAAYHVPGLMSRIRVLLVGKQMGLLQQCAAYRDAPLILYTSGKTGRSPIKFDAHLSFDASPDKSNRVHQNPVDLDVWLRLTSMQVSGKVYNHDLVIREIGNTIAAHRDLDMQYSVSYLASGRYNKLDNITRYALMVSRVVVSLAEHLIREEGTG